MLNRAKKNLFLTRILWLKSIIVIFWYSNICKNQIICVPNRKRIFSQYNSSNKGQNLSNQERQRERRRNEFMDKHKSMRKCDLAWMKMVYRQMHISNLQKHVTVSSTSNGNIIWPLAVRSWRPIDEYRTLDSAFVAAAPLVRPTIVFSHIIDDFSLLLLFRALLHQIHGVFL